MKRRFFAAVLLLVLAAALLCPAAFASGSFTIYFETGGGPGIPVIATTTASGKLSSLPEPTMTGYRFEGWYTDTLEGDKITLNTEFGADTTIYAHWLPLSDRQTSQTAPPAQTAALNALGGRAERRDAGLEVVERLRAVQPVRNGARVRHRLLEVRVDRVVLVEELALHAYFVIVGYYLVHLVFRGIQARTLLHLHHQHRYGINRFRLLPGSLLPGAPSHGKRSKDNKEVKV